MNPHEHRSLLRFSLLYFLGFTLLIAAGSWSYTLWMKHRIGVEARTAAALYESQCARLEKLAPQGFECPLEDPDPQHQIGALHRTVIVADTFLLIGGALLSFLLGLTALRPVREATRKMHAFAQAVAHDISTPIASAQLNLEALQKNHADAATQKRLHRIGRSLEQLGTLKTQLHHALGLEKALYDDKRFDLCEHLEQSASVFELVRCRCKKTIVKADPAMMDRVIDNLVSNALKYNRNAQPVDVAISNGMLIVKDRGQGIRHPKRAFERFYREQSSMAGFGLGLHSVRQICDHYGLKIFVESTVNEGTVIRIDLTPVYADKHSLHGKTLPFGKEETP